MTRVLVIDDDAELRAALVEGLRDAGFEVVEASDGTQGLDMQRTRPAGVVVTDLFMPGQEGMDTVFKLRVAHPETKIIVISGGTARGGTYDFLPVAKAIGADLCLRKPFKAAHLVSAIRELLNAPPQSLHSSGSQREA
jgi:DNA-binding response OmpR family regulator